MTISRRSLKAMAARIGIAVLAAVLFGPKPIGAAEQSPFEGVWILETHLGPRPLEGTFHVEGNELTGTIKLGSGPEVTITNGKINVKSISFDFPGEQKQTLRFHGSLNGDALDLVLSFPPLEDGPPYTGKRKQ
jgi:hypothetical protein